MILIITAIVITTIVITKANTPISIVNRNTDENIAKKKTIILF